MENVEGSENFDLSFLVIFIRSFPVPSLNSGKPLNAGIASIRWKNITDFLQTYRIE